MRRALTRLFAIFALLLVMALWHLVGKGDRLQRAEISSSDMQALTSPSLPLSKNESDGQKNIHSRGASPRIPSGAEELGAEELDGESSAHWSFKKNPGGDFVVKMSGGRLSFGAASPEEATRIFLARYGKGVLGFNPVTAGPLEISREEESTQVIVPQTLNGLPVYGARANFIFDSRGDLIYLVSDVYRGNSPSSAIPMVSGAQAAQLARQGLLRHLSGMAEDTSSYPIEGFKGHLMYRLKNGAISLVYRYELSLVSPLIGDMEIMVDATLGSLVLLQNLSRK